MQTTVIGIDLGKSSFHLVGHDCHGQIQFRKKLSRPKLCEFLVNHPQTTLAFEACGGAHWLGRYGQSLGHHVKLIPPQYVKAYVKSNKNDFIDADAIAEASQRPSMRFVAVKSEQAQVIGAIHRIRSGYIKERTACMSQRRQGTIVWLNIKAERKSSRPIFPSLRQSLRPLWRGLALRVVKPKT